MPEPNLRLVVTGIPAMERQLDEIDRERDKAQKELRVLIRALELEIQNLRRIGG